LQATIIRGSFQNLSKATIKKIDQDKEKNKINEKKKGKKKAKLAPTDYKPFGTYVISLKQEN